MNKYILSLDQGTTSSRAIIFNHNGKIVSIAKKKFTQIYPQPGWVEHDAKEILVSQFSVVTEALIKANIEGKDIVAIGITNQRETTVIWDRYTGEPVYKAIVWQDNRTSDYCDFLKNQGFGKKIQEKTGLIINSYFSATKIRWILENVPGVRRKAEEGILAFGTIDSWLIWQLTDNQEHVTDVSNASRTMLFNIHTLNWDQELLKLFEIPESLLPNVKSSSEIYGHTTKWTISNKIPIAGIAGDQQSSLFGHMCTKRGMVKSTYGTGSFILMNIGNKPILSKNNLLTTIAWKIKGEIQYALEGSVFFAGSAIQWVENTLNIKLNSLKIKKFFSLDNGGVYFVPAFSGLGAPYWEQNTKGIIVGITQSTTSNHLIQAVLESIAFQSMDILNAMELDSGILIKELLVDGGASINDILMQFQANILKIKIIRSKISELTAAGVAYLAGLAVGYWNNLEEIQKKWEVDNIFETKEYLDREDHIKEWYRAIKTAKAWVKL